MDRKVIDDREETAVIFRVWPQREGGDVIALMPYEPATSDGRYITSYQHIGQHGAADYFGVMRDTRPATPEQFAPLKRELEQIGYRVNWITRANRRRMQEARNAQRA